MGANMKIGIIGAGIMGSGVAQRFSQYGYEVILLDLNEKILQSSYTNIKNNIRFSNMIHKNKIQDVEGLLGRIQCTLNYSDLKEVDFIVENVPEILDIKKKVYKHLEEVCKEDAVYLVNTSCISITKIGSYTNRADRVIGTHFMNPVPLKRAAEVIKGYYTSHKTIQVTKDLLNSMEIRPIIVNDFPGFVSNRISHLFMNEAALVIQDGVAEPEDVDEIFKSCFEHKMGPLETADLIGLDTVVQSLDVLYESYQDPKYRVAPLLRKMVDAGLHGRKNGEGFYKYNDMI